MQNLENQITEIAGETFNVSSPKQVGEVLFDKLGLKGGKRPLPVSTAPVKVCWKNWNTDC